MGSNLLSLLCAEHSETLHWQAEELGLKLASPEAHLALARWQLQRQEALSCLVTQQWLTFRFLFLAPAHSFTVHTTITYITLESTPKQEAGGRYQNLWKMCEIWHLHSTWLVQVLFRISLDLGLNSPRFTLSVTFKWSPKVQTPKTWKYEIRIRKYNPRDKPGEFNAAGSHQKPVSGLCIYVLLLKD